MESNKVNLDTLDGRFQRRELIRT
uniref:Uncharacterized protein n=1 Tax=Rhizophora mucronata TaxID=61149 RepID=A0A2P2PF29_RHIMU